MTKSRLECRIGTDHTTFCTHTAVTKIRAKSAIDPFISPPRHLPRSESVHPLSKRLSNRVRFLSSTLTSRRVVFGRNHPNSKQLIIHNIIYVVASLQPTFFITPCVGASQFPIAISSLFLFLGKFIPKQQFLPRFLRPEAGVMS